MSEPPRSTIRRTAAILAASLLLLVGAGVPAWAGSSFVEPGVEADVDQGLTLTVTEPAEDNEEYGDTARVVVTAPTGFTVLSCDSTPIDWSCTVAENGTRLTLTRTSPVALADTRDFGFTVHTSPVNGQYAFKVVQADGPPSEEDPPTTVSSRPAVTVTGGRAPEPEPTPPAADGGSQGGTGGSTDGGIQGDDTEQDAGATDGGDAAAGGDETDSDDSSTSGGSTAPRRTQGRTSGTTLEITPGEATGDDPDIAPPDVADDPAIAPPDDGPTDDSTDSAAAAAAGTQPSNQPGDGPPWQQLVGAAMLLVGVAVVAIRRWDLAGRLRGSEPLTLLRRWRDG